MNCLIFQHQGVTPVAAPRLSDLPLGARSQRPFSGAPSRAEKQAPESKRGTQSQSMLPSLPTSAALCVSPMTA